MPQNSLTYEHVNLVDLAFNGGVKFVTPEPVKISPLQFSPL